MRSGAYPELELMYHIPNGGYRSKAEAARFRREGVKPGVPDICLPVPRGEYHGLYIELKRRDGGKVSKFQTEWIAKLNENGYLAVVCNGWEKAAETITQYLKNESKERLTDQLRKLKAASRVLQDENIRMRNAIVKIEEGKI